MKRFVIRTFKWLNAIVACLLVLVVGAALVLLAYPQLVVNDHFMIVGSHLAGRVGLSVWWDKGHVTIESPGLLRKRVHFDFSNLCIRYPAQGLDACFDQAKFSAAGGLVRFKPEVSEIGPVDFRGGRVIYAAVDGPAKKPEAENKETVSQKKGDLIPSFLAQTRLLPLHIDIPGWKYRSGSSTIAGGLELQSETGAKGEGKIGLKAQAEVEPARQHASVKLDLENARGFLQLGGWRLEASARAELPDGTRAQVQAKLDPKQGAGNLDYTYVIDADYVKARAKANAQVKGEVSPDKILATVSATAKHFVPQLGQVWVKGCELGLEREASETRPGSLSVNCPIEAQIPVPPHGFPPVALPARAGARVYADLHSSAFPPSADANVDGKVGVELSPVLTPILQGGGKVESQLAGIPKDFPRGWKMDTDLGINLKVASFERLVSQLAHTPFDVWAPLRVLKGEVDVNIKGKFDANSGTAPVQLKTRLASRAQKLNLDANGTLQLIRLRPSPRAHLSMDVVLSEIQLELPPLPELPSLQNRKLDPLPQFVPDGRFTHAIKAEPAKQLAGIQEPAFTYDVKIHTLDDQHPIQFLTPQIKAPIPLGVNVALSSDTPLSGQVKILSFPLELFKRDVTLDHVTVTLSPDSKDNKLDGRITIPYTDYTITVLLLGTTDKPTIKFLSDPPLPDTQIIAVLIFGQSLDALDPDQQQSVGNSRAALLSGALSLASLYYLSSMNIESVDYDPTTGTASLRYRLAAGTSLNVSQGVGGGQPSVGIRKRLSRHLAITTTLNNPSEQQTDRTISTFLEWAYQY